MYTNETKKPKHNKLKVLDRDNEENEMYTHVQHRYKAPTKSKAKLKSRLSRRSFKVQIKAKAHKHIWLSLLHYAEHTSSRHYHNKILQHKSYRI